MIWLLGWPEEMRTSPWVGINDFGGVRTQFGATNRKIVKRFRSHDFILKKIACSFLLQIRKFPELFVKFLNLKTEQNFKSVNIFELLFSNSQKLFSINTENCTECGIFDVF